MKVKSAGFLALGMTSLAMSVVFAGVVAAGFVFYAYGEGRAMTFFVSLIALVFGLTCVKVATDSSEANG